MFELLIGTGGSMVLLAVALLLEKKTKLLYLPFAKVGKAALTLYSTQFILAWILMLVGIEPSSLAQFPGWRPCGHPHHAGGRLGIDSAKKRPTGNRDPLV